MRGDGEFPIDRGELKRTLLESGLLAALVFGMLAVLGRGFGPYWDSWFYYDQAARWGDWFASWWGGASAPSLLAQPQWYFPDQTEYARHPPLLEIGGGFFNALLGDSIGQLSSCRLIVSLFASLFSAACYAFLRGRIGRGPAILGVALYWGSPRFFLHAVLFAIDGLIAAMYGLGVLSLFLWDRGLKGKAVIFVALLAATLTKLQGYYLFPLLFLWVGWTVLNRQGMNRESLRGLLFEWMQAGLLSAGILLSAFILWPANWMNWPEGFRAYLDFITRHSNIPVLYFGELYKGDSRPPWHYPWVFPLIAIPFWTTFPVIVRVFRLSISAARGGLGGFQPGEFLLWAGMLLPLFISSMPMAPKYDGIRLLLPAFGPMTVIAALELARWWKWGIDRLGGSLSEPIRGAILAVIILFVLLPTIRIYPHNLVYYNLLIGGQKGARKAGFELEFLGVTMHHLNPALSEKARPGDILLLAGANAVVRPDPGESWPPLPEGIHIVDFKMLPELSFQNRRVFAILSSRYADLREMGELVLEKIPPIASVEYGEERLFSLHEIPPSFVRDLPDHLKNDREARFR